MKKTCALIFIGFVCFDILVNFLVLFWIQFLLYGVDT